MTDLLAMERRDRSRDKRSRMDGDDMEAEYKRIQERLEALRNRMRATYNRFPGQIGWVPAIKRCESIISAVTEARGLKAVVK